MNANAASIQLEVLFIARDAPPLLERRRGSAMSYDQRIGATILAIGAVLIVLGALVS